MYFELEGKINRIGDETRRNGSNGAVYVERKIMLSEAFQTKDGKTMLSYPELTFDGKNCEALKNMKEG